jgi:hypothetical protein
MMALPTDAQARKNIPVYSGFIKYFPRAMCAVAHLSKIGNDQHNPGQPLHWAKEKSKDEMDALCRHMIDDAMGIPADTDGVAHATKLAWRAMANLERLLEAAEKEECRPYAATSYEGVPSMPGNVLEEPRPVDRSLDNLLDKLAEQDRAVPGKPQDDDHMYDEVQGGDHGA